MFRIRLRTLMIVVAVIALLLGRSMNFWNRERDHRREMATIILNDLEDYLLLTPASRGGTMHPESGDPIVEAMAPLYKFVMYHKAMAEKYELAARRPWFPVAADPLAPPRPTLAEVARYRDLLELPTPPSGTSSINSRTQRDREPFSIGLD